MAPEISGRTAPELALRSIEENSIPEVEDHVLKNYPLNAVEDIEINGRPYTAFAVFEHSNHDLPFFNPFGTGILFMFSFGCPDSDGFCFCNFAYYYTRPLRKLDGAMRAFAEGKLDTRVENSNGRADAEVAALAACKSSKDHSKPRNEVDTSLKSPV